MAQSHESDDNSEHSGSSEVIAHRSHSSLKSKDSPAPYGVDQLQLQLSSLTPQTANLVAKMSVLNPEVLRVTPAYKAFQRCAEAFQQNERELHHKSQRSEEITRFWSHSWHGSVWQKVLTLLTLYNGLASILLGTVAAFAMMWLFAFGFLPGFRRFKDVDWLWSNWSLMTGLVVSIASFVLWKPQEKVFFDRICISEDSELKAEAIFSLAGMLKKSKHMLVLWDPSWSDRLWCLFELAAFLKCKKEGSQQVLKIRPTFVGPCSVAVFLTCAAAMMALTTLPMPEDPEGRGFSELVPVIGLLAFGAVTGWGALMAFRGYFYSLTVLDKKLKSISFEEVRSSCCELNHVNTAGHPMLCDREVVKQCVAIWFGSTAAFEEMVRSDFSEKVATELLQNVFTRGWVLQAFAPLVWGFIDLAASLLRKGHWEQAFEFMVIGLVLWLLGAPVVELGILLTRRYCSEAKCRTCGPFADFFLKLGLWFLVATFVGFLCSIFLALRFAIPHSMNLTRSAAFVGAMLVISIFTCALESAFEAPPMKSAGTNAGSDSQWDSMDKSLVIGSCISGASFVSQCFTCFSHFQAVFHLLQRQQFGILNVNLPDPENCFSPISISSKRQSKKKVEVPFFQDQIRCIQIFYSLNTSCWPKLLARCRGLRRSRWSFRVEKATTRQRWMACGTSGRPPALTTGTFSQSSPVLYTIYSYTMSYQQVSIVQHIIYILYYDYAFTVFRLTVIEQLTSWIMLKLCIAVATGN